MATTAITNMWMTREIRRLWASSSACERSMCSASASSRRSLDARSSGGSAVLKSKLIFGSTNAPRSTVLGFFGRSATYYSSESDQFDVECVGIPGDSDVPALLLSIDRRLEHTQG